LKGASRGLTFVKASESMKGLERGLKGLEGGLKLEGRLKEA